MQLHFLSEAVYSILYLLLAWAGFYSTPDRSIIAKLTHDLALMDTFLESPKVLVAQALL